MARYHWNVRLAEALAPALHATEICLRNAIHNAMVVTYPSSDGMWFDAPVVNASYSGPLLSDADKEKVEDARKRLARAGKAIEASRLVAKLSLGFWVELLNDDYDLTVVRPVLAGTMRRVQEPYRKQASLRDIYGKFRDLRNRVAHHEPIYDLKEDARHLHEMMLKISSEIQPPFTALVKHQDRFDTVWSSGWKPFREELLNSIKYMHAKRNASGA